MILEQALPSSADKYFPFEKSLVTVQSAARHVPIACWGVSYDQ